MSAWSDGKVSVGKASHQCTYDCRIIAHGAACRYGELISGEENEILGIHIALRRHPPAPMPSAAGAECKCAHCGWLSSVAAPHQRRPRPQPRRLLPNMKEEGGEVHDELTHALRGLAFPSAALRDVRIGVEPKHECRRVTRTATAASDARARLNFCVHCAHDRNMASPLVSPWNDAST